MPTLAKQIVDANAAGQNPPLNFKGFAVGNPYTNFYSGSPAMVATYWGHQLVAKPTWDKYDVECLQAKRPNVQTCEALYVQMMVQVGDLNPYGMA